MLIKFQVDDESIEQLKHAKGQRVGSKAASAACLAYLDQLDMIARLEKEAGQLRETIRLQQQIIDRASQAASALLARVGQKDFFDQACISE